MPCHDALLVSQSPINSIHLQGHAIGNDGGSIDPAILSATAPRIGAHAANGNASQQLRDSNAPDIISSHQSTDLGSSHTRVSSVQQDGRSSTATTARANIVAPTGDGMVRTVADMIPGMLIRNFATGQLMRYEPSRHDAARAQLDLQVIKHFQSGSEYPHNELFDPRVEPDLVWNPTEASSHPNDFCDITAYPFEDVDDMADDFEYFPGCPGTSESRERLIQLSARHQSLQTRHFRFQ